MDLLQHVQQHWSWTGLEPKELVAQNEFGNLIIKDIRARYWRICPEELSCEIVADDGEEFSELVETEDFQIDWEMSQLVELARQELGSLTDSRVYYLVIPAVLGGAYVASNIRTVEIKELISLTGGWAEEIKDLPDGAQIKLKVID